MPNSIGDGRYSKWEPSLETEPGYAGYYCVKFNGCKNEEVPMSECEGYRAYMQEVFDSYKNTIWNQSEKSDR